MTDRLSTDAALKGGPIWMVTFATYRRREVFANPRLRQACGEALGETAERNGYVVYALAIMPDHVHLILDAGASGHLAPKVLNNLKGVVSRRIFQASPELKLDLGSNHLWADEYQARALGDKRELARACRYVRQNPVEIGWVRQHYPWVRTLGAAV
jgi:REP element-mobilizing transposase RayT